VFVSNLVLVLGLNHTHESEHLRFHAGENTLKDHIRVGKIESGIAVLAL